MTPVPRMSGFYRGILAGRRKHIPTHDEAKLDYGRLARVHWHATGWNGGLQ